MNILWQVQEYTQNTSITWGMNKRINEHIYYEAEQLNDTREIHYNI